MIAEELIDEYLLDNYGQFLEECTEKTRTSTLEIDYEQIKDFCKDEPLKNIYTVLNDLVNIETEDKNKIYIQLKNAPITHKISKLDSQDVGEFISATATIKSITNTSPKVLYAQFKCMDCGYVTDYKIEDYKHIVPPNECPKCGKTIIEMNTTTSKVQNVRYLQLEEPLEYKDSTGNSPTFTARVEGHFASAAFPLSVGDTIDIAGEFKLEHYKNKIGEYYYNLDLKSIKHHDTLFESKNLTQKDIEKIIELSKNPDIFKILTVSVAPMVIGHRDIKEGLVLQQFGSVKTRDVDRAEIHILLIGDPGVAKSLFLDSIEKVAAKAVRAGPNSSSAGLTAAVVRDEFTNMFTVNAGAIVLAHRGFVLIDEYDKLTPDDQKATNEAMEQGRVSVAKAGITQTLKCNTSFLCAANPKYGRFTAAKPLIEQINMPASTLSRFDLSYIIEDLINEEKDYSLLKSALLGEVDETEYEILSPEMFMKYVTYARENVFPQLTEEAAHYLSKFYANLRQETKDEDDLVPITRRDGMALGRLVIARAKAELREEVTVDDVKDAIRIYEDSLKTAHLDLRTAGNIFTDTTEKDVKILVACEEQLDIYFGEWGNYDCNKEQVDEMKANVMSELGCTIEEVDKAFTRAYANVTSRDV